MRNLRFATLSAALALAVTGALPMTSLASAQSNPHTPTAAARLATPHLTPQPLLRSDHVTLTSDYAKNDATTAKNTNPYAKTTTTLDSIGAHLQSAADLRPANTHAMYTNLYANTTMTTAMTIGAGSSHTVGSPHLAYTLARNARRPDVSHVRRC